MRCPCGDPVSVHAEFEPDWTATQRRSLKEFRRTRCETCARELSLGTIPRLATTMHDAGGGTRVIRSGKEMT
jgi:hypothetical protein